METSANNSVRFATISPSEILTAFRVTVETDLIVPTDISPPASIQVTESALAFCVTFSTRRSFVSNNQSGVGSVPVPVNDKVAISVASGLACVPTPAALSICNQPPVTSVPVDAVRSMPSGATSFNVEPVPKSIVSSLSSAKPLVAMISPPPASLALSRGSSLATVT